MKIIYQTESEILREFEVNQSNIDEESTQEFIKEVQESFDHRELSKLEFTFVKGKVFVVDANKNLDNIVNAEDVLEIKVTMI